MRDEFNPCVCTCVGGFVHMCVKLVGSHYESGGIEGCVCVCFRHLAHSVLLNKFNLIIHFQSAQGLRKLTLPMMH